MSLKDNIDMVKEELNSEEKFFEKAVITERFIKKYKNIMIGSLVAVVVVVGANIAYDMNKNAKIESANIALNTLMQDAHNADALKQLEAESPALHDAWIYSQAIANKDALTLKSLTNSKAPFISDLASYELANDSKSFEEYASKEGAVYRDLAIVQSAVILINENKIDEAHLKLQMISTNSSLSKIAAALLHYGVK